MYRIFFALCSFLTGAAQAGVVINEIHYHPVEERAFNTDGTPVLDLSSNVHEFVELYNTGPAVDLTGWRISGDISYSFPAGASLASNAYLVIARDTNRIVNLYGLPSAQVYGPFPEELPNGKGTVRLRDAAKVQVDRVNYADDEPWPGAADALGAGQSFYTDLDLYAYQYTGRSLERVSPDAPSSNPANWLASPLSPGPSPGEANAITRVTPKPIVLTRASMQDADEAPVIRANAIIRVVVQFSDTNNLNNVQLDWWVDDIESFNETRTTTNMVYLGNAQYSGLITGQADRSVIRYRIRADRGDGLELVSPRSDGLAFTPVSASQREAWHGLFVEPQRSGSRPAYDFFVSAADVTQLTSNSTQGPKRVFGNPQYPRDDPKKGYAGLPQYDPSRYPADNQPHWDGLVWAIFVHEGEVFDTRVRFHGSRWRRGAGLNSWKIGFPASQKMQGKQRMLVTEKNDSTIVGMGLFAEAGIPANFAQYVDFYRNNDNGIRRAEISDMDEERLRDFQAAERARRPQNPPEFKGLGIVYKAKGLNGSEGPYGWANGQPMPATGDWSELDRYIHTYASQLNDWVGHSQLQTMMDEVWAARGDRAAIQYPSTYNGTGHGNQTAVNINTANLRSYLLENWNVDQMLTYLALRNWSKPWDDKFHNWYLYQQGDGKWTMAPWDFDNEITGNVNESIFAGRKDDTAGTYSNNSRGPNWFKDNVLRAFETEYKERLFLLNHTLLDPANVSAIAARYGGAVNANWVLNRHNAINTQLNMGTFERPGQPTVMTPGNNSTALPGSHFSLSDYAHSSGSTHGIAAHTKTIWEIRDNDGGYATPVFYMESTNALTQLEIPFEELAFGKTYAWRASYMDANGHPSLTSSESSFTFGTQPSAVTLLTIDGNTSWRYNVTQSFSNTTTGPNDPNWWGSTPFNDSAWPSGSPLFADETAALPFPELTEFNRNGRMVFYYRTRFSFPGSPTGASLSVRHVVDDGMVVYINGIEVPEARFNMPAPPFPDNQGASPTVSDAVLSAPIPIPSTYFVPGENIVAVEVHQANNSSSDTVFGLELSGTVPFGTGDVVINEVLAANRRAHEHLGEYPDYIELYNNLFTPVDLDGWSLTDDILKPYRFVFPTNTMIGPRETLLVYAGDAQGTNALYTGFGIDTDGQTLALVQDQTVHDSVSFGPQATDGAIGRSTDGEADWGLIETSPDAPNTSATLGSVTKLVLNEWMAKPDGGDDWFEIHNSGSEPVSLAELYLSDNPADRQLSQVPALSFIAGLGHTRFDADDRTGANHVNFKLAGAGDQLLLTDVDGFTPLDQQSFGVQVEGISSGRFPDGAVTIVAFTNTPSPGESNYLPAPIWINEALANTPDAAESDTIELFNPGPGSLDLSGWWLSDDPGTADKFVIPPGTILSNGAFAVFTEAEFNPTPGIPPSFALSSLGDELVLTGINGQGRFNGFRARQNFGPSAAHTSFGRVPILGGVEFWPQLDRTLGRSNRLAKTTPVIINEVHYHPPDHTNAVDNTEDEFIELHIHHTQPVDLSAWRLKNTVDYVFPAGSVYQAGAYILLVAFNPTNTTLLTDFRATFGVSTHTPILGPYAPKLPNSDGKIELGRPGIPVNLITPTLLVDKIAYEDAGYWPIAADGSGASLQRQDRLVIGNDPANWLAAAPTPGAVNAGQFSLMDSDLDGIPDHWETALQMNPQSSTDAEADDDMDGLSNSAEFRAGTDQNDGDDKLKQAAEAIADDWIIRFQAKADRSYRVWVRDQLDGSNWNLLTTVPAQPADYEAVVNDHGATGERRYYRVSTP